MGIAIGSGISISGGITITYVSDSGGESYGSETLSDELDSIADYIGTFLTVNASSGGLRTDSFYEYNLDGTDVFITDGGNDMLDNGNYTAPYLANGNTWINSASIPATVSLSYSQTVAALKDTNFKYVSLGYGNSARPLTMIGTRIGTGNVGFQKAGNMGSDGGGSNSTIQLYNGTVINGFTTYAFARQTYGQSIDPTCCDLYILLGHPSWNSSFGTVNSSLAGAPTVLQGAAFWASNSQNILAITTLLSRTSPTPFSNADLQAVVTNYTSLIESTLPPSPPGVDLIRAALSPSTQITYDATANGNWVMVSSAEYDNVAATLANTAVVGGSRNIDRSNLWSPEVSVTGWKHGYPSSLAEIPAGSYIIGWVAPASVRSASATAYQIYDFMQSTQYTNDLNDYNKIGQSVTSQLVVFPANGELNYYILKNPTELNINSTRYVAFRALRGNLLAGTAIYSDSSSISGQYWQSSFGWAGAFRNLPNFQTLITSVKQW